MTSPKLPAVTGPAHVQARQRGLAAVSARPGLLHRLKLSEPVRLYAYSILSAVLLALVIVGTITQEWQAALTGIAAAVLGVVPGAEAARATVYSEASHVRGVYAAVSQARVSSSIEKAAGW